MLCEIEKNSSSLSNLALLKGGSSISIIILFEKTIQGVPIYKQHSKFHMQYLVPQP